MGDPGRQFHEEASRERQDRQTAEETALIKALGLAHYWPSLLDEGKYQTITEIAAAEGMDMGQASRIAKLTQLAPEIIEAGMAGSNAPPLESLFRRSFPADWSTQKHEMLPADG